MLVWCPDWPVVAAEIVDGVAASGPVAVLHANRVVASSPAARAEGVRRGLRKRDAQSRCPQLTVVDHDPSRDMRAYEPVVAAVEELVAGVAVLRPGVCAFHSSVSPGSRWSRAPRPSNASGPSVGSRSKPTSAAGTWGASWRTCAARSSRGSPFLQATTCGSAGSSSTSSRRSDAS